MRIIQAARRMYVVCALSCFAMLPVAALAAPAHDDDDDDDDDVRPSAAPAEIVITAHHLDAARNTVEASLGATTFALDNEALESRPAGETTSIAQALLQAPGVAQVGKGAISVRGSQSGVQYRINNIIIPGGVADLGEQLSPRLAERIELITGALPAQYGLEVGGVVNITTKNGLYGAGGQLELYGGSHGQFEPAIEYGGASGATSYFVTGSYLRDDVGLASPDGSSHPAHDRTDQIEGMTFIDHVIDSQSRLSLIAGASNERFEIPEGPTDRSGPPANLPENPFNGGYMHRADQFGALSYLTSDKTRTLQISLFGRHSRNTLQPGASAGLDITGLGGRIAEIGLAGGLQMDGDFHVDEHHILRIGGVFNYDTIRSRFRGSLQLSGPAGLGTAAITNRDKEHRTGTSLFAQDEWKPADRLTVNFGARFDKLVGEVGGSSLGPRLNLVWAAASGTVLHGGYARYLVVPSLYPAWTGGALAISSTKIRAENDNYYDFGVQQKVGRITFGIDAFRRDADHLISELQEGSPLMSRPFNYRRGRFTGIELSATYHGDKLAGWANLSFIDAKARTIEAGQGDFAPAQLDYVANHWVRPEGTQRFAASAGGTYRSGRLSLGTELLYGSGMSQGDLPGYIQANFDVTFRVEGIGARPLDLRMDVINAFDRRYQIDTRSNAGLPQWGPRRGLFVGAEQAF